MIGVDTTAIIDLFKGVVEVKKKIQELNLPLCTTITSYLELMFGLDFFSKAHKVEEEYYDEFFDATYLFDIDRNSCKRAAQINNFLKKKGEEINEYDCLIAAIFLSKGIDKILTRNAKHYQKIPGIKVIKY